MRLALSGFGGPLVPLFLKLPNGIPFLKAAYVAMGYTDFDVICIGGAGGRGGGAIPNAPFPAGAWQLVSGGGGGGGGLQRVKGLLLGLPASVPVVVGAAGATGTYNVTPNTVAGITDGGDGGVSSFNGATCQASGGKGGKGVASISTVTNTGGNGGAGGIGGSAVAGGGAAGGVATNPSTDGADGGWDGAIGIGGGGGAGGSATHSGGAGSSSFGPYIGIGGNGGDGAYSLADTSFSCPGGAGQNTSPGSGGGARSTPLDHLLRAFGTYTDAPVGTVDQKGAVIILLTQA